jgi:hypothetical protein
MKAAEDAHYIMGATTSSTGNGLNSCGIVLKHAYSILAAFTMTDTAGTAHRCLLMRSPWGYSQYNYTWNKDDPNWTNSLA